LQGFMLVMAGIFLLINLITDLTYAAIDPRAGLSNG
jgi:peptide/nickel transport system permease protein